MVIYADILILTNLYIDFLLLCCVKRFLHLRAKTTRLLIGSLVGAACSLSALLPALPPSLNLVIGIATALITTSAAFLPLNLFMYIKTAISFWAFSFIFAGFFLFISHFFSTHNLSVNNGTVYFNISPLVLFVSTCGAYLCIIAFNKLFPSRDSDIHFCKITVEVGEKSVILLGKADTANSLREPFSGLPVIVAEAEALKEIVPTEISNFLKNTESGDNIQLEHTIRLIPFSGLGASGVLAAFKPDNVHFSKFHAINPYTNKTAYNKKHIALSDSKYTAFSAVKSSDTCDKNSAVLCSAKRSAICYIAISPKSLSAGQFNALFNPAIITENPS